MSKTVWVVPGKGAKIPAFLGNGGELHTRVVQEMKTVLLGTDEAPYLDAPARELLSAGRHVAHIVGLDKSDFLVTPGGICWFPWVGTRCLRTLSILAELNRVTCETDRLSIWLPLPTRDEFLDFLRQLLANNLDSSMAGSRVTPRVVEKFDEFLPDDLLTRACASERLALQEAIACLKTVASKASPAPP